MTFWKNLKDWARSWWQWLRCCRKSHCFYVTYAYKECCVCGTLYWRD